MEWPRPGMIKEEWNHVHLIQQNMELPGGRINVEWWPADVRPASMHACVRQLMATRTWGHKRQEVTQAQHDARVSTTFLTHCHKSAARGVQCAGACTGQTPWPPCACACVRTACVLGEEARPKTIQPCSEKQGRPNRASTRFLARFFLDLTVCAGKKLSFRPSSGREWTRPWPAVRLQSRERFFVHKKEKNKKKSTPDLPSHFLIFFL